MTPDWQTLSVRIGDVLFGWSLKLPRDVTVLVLVLLSTAFMLLLRRTLSNQTTIRQTVDDMRRLRCLRRTAIATTDVAAAERCRRVRQLVIRKKIAGELLPTFASIVPLMLLVVWGSVRLDDLPPQGGQKLQLRAILPASSVGEVIHLVPEPGIDVEKGWVRTIRRDHSEGISNGVAKWDFTAVGRVTAYRLIVRFRDTKAVHTLRVGQSKYEPATQNQNGEFETNVGLHQFYPLGVLRGFDFVGLSPWMIAYFCGTACLFFVGRRLLKIY